MGPAGIDVRGSEEVPDDFLALPAVVYRNDPFYCMSPPDAVRADVLRPSFRERQEVLVAWRDSRPVARAVARLSPALRDPTGAPCGMIGFFEALDDGDAVRALFDRAVAWLRGHGAGAILGPMNGDTWHSYRLNIGPFDQRPFLMEPYHPPYYRALWERRGFQPLEGYSSAFIARLDAAIANTEAIARRCEKRGYVLERFRLDRFESELARLHALSCAIFEGNYLYSPLTREEFIALYADSRRLLDSDLIWFARAPAGADAGFVFAFADCHRAVRAMEGRRSLPAMLKFLVLKGKTDTVNVKTLGVRPEVRGSGVALLLMNRVYRAIREKGYRRANLCLMRDGNPSARMDGAQGQPLRRYVLYRLEERATTA